MRPPQAAFLMVLNLPSPFCEPATLSGVTKVFHPYPCEKDWQQREKQLAKRLRWVRISETPPRGGRKLLNDPVIASGLLILIITAVLGVLFSITVKMWALAAVIAMILAGVAVLAFNSRTLPDLRNGATLWPVASQQDLEPEPENAEAEGDGHQEVEV